MITRMIARETESTASISLIKDINELGMIVDLLHVSQETVHYAKRWL